jgi:hypothetical protein
MKTLFDQSCRAVLAISLLQTIFLQKIEAGKRRSWLGPTNFVQGTPPTSRSEHGIEEVDGKVFVFGGKDEGNLIGYSVYLHLASQARQY